MTAQDLLEEELEYVQVSGQALRTSGGDAALDALGWWDLLTQLDDPASRTAAFALFRAQGRELASSIGLGALVAQPYLHAAGIEPGWVIVTVRRDSARGDGCDVVVGEPDGHQLLVDRPGRGAVIVGLDQVELRRIDQPGRLVVHEVTVDDADASPAIAEHDAAVARARSRFLGRVALALEIIGAAEGALALAVEHAGGREQFGEPIGRFQAVRHLLAWAHTDCTAASNVARRAVMLDAGAPDRYDEVAKAIAGRNGRKASERSLQVLGGIGFTAEHDHHHFHSRVLALDVLLGRSSALTNDLGRWLRTEQRDPRFASAVLHARP